MPLGWTRQNGAGLGSLLQPTPSQFARQCWSLGTDRLCGIHAVHAFKARVRYQTCNQDVSETLESVESTTSQAETKRDDIQREADRLEI